MLISETKEYNKKRAAKHRAEHPEKVKARKAIYHLIRAKKIIKEPCFCGSLKVEAHHDDYNEPLKVAWLCRKHHREIHPK